MKLTRSKPDPDHVHEKEVWSGGYSTVAFYGSLIFLGIFVVIAAIVLYLIPAIRTLKYTWLMFGTGTIVGVLVVAAVFLYNRFSRWYVLTNERLIHREGIFVRRHHILELIRVDDVTYEQGPIESLMGCGSIFVASSDTSHPELELTGIEDVQTVADLIDSCRRKERKQRGLHVESI